MLRPIALFPEYKYLPVFVLRTNCLISLNALIDSLTHDEFLAMQVDFRGAIRWLTFFRPSDNMQPVGGN